LTHSCKAPGFNPCAYKVRNWLQSLLVNASRATTARAPNQPLSNETVIVAPPRKGEIRIKVMSNALCHTDIYTLVGLDTTTLHAVIF
jgi:hypothetical protein